jgi:two-component system heavy metal sensor histidine kinase CusS
MFLKNVQSKGASRRRVRQWSIARRLTLLYVAATALLLVLAAAYLYWSQVKNLEREDDDFLISKIQDCRRLLEEHPEDTRLLVNEVQIEADASLPKYYERLLDDQGRVLIETKGMSELLSASRFPASLAMGDSSEPKTTTTTAAGKTYLLMSAESRGNGERSRARILHVALDVSPEEALIAGYRWKLLMVVAMGIVFSAGAGVFVTRKGLLPLKEITRATERITASQLHERIVADGWPMELASLAQSFDRMLDRLEDSFSRLSQFSADLAHELRTPINNLRGEAGVALSQSRTPEEYRRTLESSLEEYARLTRLIDNLLFLARAESPEAGISSARFDARQAIEAVRDYYEALAEERGIELRCDGEGRVMADPVLFRQAVSNLLSNALNCTPRGGHVLIRASQNNGSLQIIVSDTGCGIFPEHLPRVFDRLYRVDMARSQNPNGAGLGLAIVKSIVKLHGGTVEVQSFIDKGTTFSLSFPATAVHSRQS